MRILARLLFCICLFTGIHAGYGQEQGTAAQDFSGKKVLLIDSYHEGYEWSDGIVKGVRGVLDGTGVDLRIHRMDTKRHDNEAFFKQAGLKAKAVIDEWQPDIVIAADDNASRYVVAPFFRNSAIPFVFCGINWDVSEYGYPYENATGMIEVNAVDELIDLILQMADGRKVGVLTSDVETEHKENRSVQKVFGIEFAQEVYVKSFEEWKKAYEDLQGKVDILLVQNNAGIKDWDDDEAVKFVRAHTRIPSGTVNTYMAPYAMIGYAKLPEEQGEWAAETALKILGGAAPADIPIAKNVKGKLYVNLPIAGKLGIDIPADLLEVADVIE